MDRRHVDNRSGRQMVDRDLRRIHQRVSRRCLYFHRDIRQRRREPHCHSSDPRRPPFESVGLAFNEETLQLSSTPSFIQVDQFITAEQAGIDILQRDAIITNGQANTLQNFFQSELQVLGKQALSSNLLSAPQIAKLTALQADTASYVAKTPALVALQPDHTGWAMPSS
jgi:hypothetical protein